MITAFRPGQFGGLHCAATALAVLVLTGVGAVAEPQERGDCWQLGAGLPESTVVVSRVVDGDTLRLVNGGLVRLAGIAAPKPLDDGNAALTALPDRARHLVERLVLGGPVRLRASGDGPDRYGRTHAHVIMPDGRWLQSEIVAAGMARVIPLPGENLCTAQLLSMESGARRAGLGLWQTKEYAVRRAVDPSLSQRNGIYEVVEGRIVSVGERPYMVFLDFGRDYRADFTIMVPIPVAERFVADSGLAMSALRGRRVRVRGVIEESGGPAVRLSDPIEMELLDENDAGSGARQ